MKKKDNAATISMEQLDKQIEEIKERIQLLLLSDISTPHIESPVLAFGELRALLNLRGIDHQRYEPYIIIGRIIYDKYKIDLTTFDQLTKG